VILIIVHEDLILFTYARFFAKKQWIAKVVLTVTLGDMIVPRLFVSHCPRYPRLVH
jgi:hypothetical protein